MAENSGIGVTRGSEVGANFLNFCNAKQESDAAMMTGYILQMAEEGVMDGNLGIHTTEW